MPGRRQVWGAAIAPAGSVPRLLAEAATEPREWSSPAAPAALSHVRSDSKLLERVEAAELATPGLPRMPVSGSTDLVMGRLLDAACGGARALTGGPGAPRPKRTRLG